MGIRLDNSADQLAVASGPTNAVLTAIFFAKISVDRNNFSTVLNLGSSTTNYVVFQTDSNGTTMQMWLNGAGITVNTSGINMVVGRWYAFAGVIASTISRTFYWKLATATAVSSSSPAATIVFGAFNQAKIGQSAFAGDDYNGCIAGIKIYEAALSQAQIENEWRQIAPIRTANLWAFYPLLAGGLAATPDWSGNGKTLTLAGTIDDSDNNPEVPWRLGQSPSRVSHH